MKKQPTLIARLVWQGLSEVNSFRWFQLCATYPRGVRCSDGERRYRTGAVSVGSVARAVLLFVIVQYVHASLDFKNILAHEEIEENGNLRVALPARGGHLRRRWGPCNKTRRRSYRRPGARPPGRRRVRRCDDRVARVREPERPCIVRRRTTRMPTTGVLGVVPDCITASRVRSLAGMESL